jgi:hypothetical protein
VLKEKAVCEHFITASHIPKYDRYVGGKMDLVVPVCKYFMNVYKGYECKVPHILDFGNRWRQVVRFMLLLLLYPQ